MFNNNVHATLMVTVILKPWSIGFAKEEHKKKWISESASSWNMKQWRRDLISSLHGWCGPPPKKTHTHTHTHTHTPHVGIYAFDEMDLAFENSKFSLIWLHRVVKSFDKHFINSQKNNYISHSGRRFLDFFHHDYSRLTTHEETNKCSRVRDL